MKDLESTLHTLEVPDPGEKARSAALLKAQAALGRRAEPSELLPPGRRRALQPVLAAAAVLVVIASWFQLSSNPPGSTTTQSWDETVTRHEKLLAEVRELFGGRLVAVLSDESGVDLRVSSTPRAISDQPILLEICGEAGHCMRVVSFSGETLTATLGSRTLELELLVTGTGGVVVSEKSFVWSSRGDAGPPDLRLRAQVLGS